MIRRHPATPIDKAKILKEAELYVVKVDEGLYYVEKDSQEGINKFLDVKELHYFLNVFDCSAIERDEAIAVYRRFEESVDDTARPKTRDNPIYPSTTGYVYEIGKNGLQLKEEYANPSTKNSDKTKEQIRNNGIGKKALITKGIHKGMVVTIKNIGKFTLGIDVEEIKGNSNSFSFWKMSMSSLTKNNIGFKVDY